VNVFAFGCKLEQCVEVRDLGGDLLVLRNLFFQALAILHDLLAFFRMIPEVRRVDLVFGGG
jgi:hypothetical protein